MRMIIAALLLVACASCQHSANRSYSGSAQYESGYPDNRYRPTR